MSETPEQYGEKYQAQPMGPEKRLEALKEIRFDLHTVAERLQNPLAALDALKVAQAKLTKLIEENKAYGGQGMSEQRAIKFRAWNRLTKNMIDLQAVTPLALDSKLTALGTKGLFIPFDPDLVLMQYTGLQDSQGQEIYEGDILELNGATAKVVYWTNPPEFGLDYYHNEDKWCDDWNLSDDSERMKIIGNIYDHPHLLQGA